MKEKASLSLNVTQAAKDSLHQKTVVMMSSSHMNATFLFGNVIAYILQKYT